MTEVSETEEVTVALTPSNQEIKGELFILKISDLKISIIDIMKMT